MDGKETEKKSLREKLSARLAPVSGNGMLVLCGQSVATLHGCRRILHYSDREIALSVGKTVLSVRGEGLVFSSLSAGSVTVRGTIVSVAYGSEARE